MPLSFNFELSDQDLSHIQQAIAAAQKAALGKSDADITAAARAMAARATVPPPPDATPNGMYQPAAVLAICGDATWALRAIELSVRELKHEIDAYSEFCEYRQEQAASRGLDAAAVGRADWLSSRRDELINRMHRRRNLDGSGSYGSSSGYGGGKSYVSNAWRPGLLRVR